jgi:hypothetical protein
MRSKPLNVENPGRQFALGAMMKLPVFVQTMQTSLGHRRVRASDLPSVTRMCYCLPIMIRVSFAFYGVLDVSTILPPGI